MMGGWATTMAVMAMMGMFLQGCGYQFAVEGPGPRIGGGPAMMDDEAPVVRLAIRNFRNRTFHHHLEDVYTRYMRQEFSVGSGAHVVADEAQADYVMTGEIVSVAVSSLTFSPDETRERRVDVVVNATVRHRQGDTAWTGTATGTGDFFVNRAPDAQSLQDEIQFNRVLQERAMEQAGQDAAEALAALFWDARRQGSFSSGPSSPSSSSSSSSDAPAPILVPVPALPSAILPPLLERLP